MPKRRVLFVLACGLGLGVAFGCTDLSYNCAGICGTTIGNGDFEGTVSANSLAEAVAACTAKLACDAGYQPNCSCYLVE